MSACGRQPDKQSQRCWQTEVNDWSAVWCDLNITSVRLFCAACLTRLCTILCLSSVFTSPSKSIRSFRGVLTLLQDQSGHSYTDQNSDKIGWALQELAADGHTLSHKEGNNEVPPELPHDKHQTNSPWRQGGKEKLFLCVIPHSVSNLSPLSDCPPLSFFFTSLPHLSLLTLSYPLCWLNGWCVCVDGCLVETALLD